MEKMDKVNESRKTRDAEGKVEKRVSVRKKILVSVIATALSLAVAALAVEFYFRRQQRNWTPPRLCDRTAHA